MIVSTDTVIAMGDITPEHVGTLPGGYVNAPDLYHGRWVRALLPLMEKPGEWFLLEEGNHASMRVRKSNLIHKKIKRPAGNFEFYVHWPDRETSLHSWLYGRYVGPEDQQVESAPYPVERVEGAVPWAADDVESVTFPVIQSDLHFEAANDTDNEPDKSVITAPDSGQDDEPLGHTDDRQAGHELLVTDASAGETPGNVDSVPGETSPLPSAPAGQEGLLLAREATERTVVPEHRRSEPVLGLEDLEL